MTILRNKTGGVASLYSVNLAQDIAADGDVDTSTLVGGLPAASPIELAQNSEVQFALHSGAWCVVEDGAELSPTASVAATAMAVERTVDDRAPIVVRATLATTANVDAVLASWPIGVGERVAVNVQHLDVEAADFASLPRGGVFQGLGKAGRVGAGAAVLIGESLLGAENVAGNRVHFAVSGNTLELRWASAAGGSITYELRYFTSTGTP